MPTIAQSHQGSQHQAGSSIQPLVTNDIRQAWEWLQRAFGSDNRISSEYYEPSNLLPGIVVCRNLQRHACGALMGFK